MNPSLQLKIQRVNGAVMGRANPRHSQCLMGLSRSVKTLLALGTILSLGLLGASTKAWAQEQGAPGRPQLTLKFKPESLQCVAWSPDGSTLATSTNFGAIRLWNARSGSLQRVLGKGMDNLGDTINTLAFSPDGKLLASGDDYREIKLWNPQTGELVRSLKQGESKLAHTDQVYSVAWSPDGKTLASGSLDKTVALWDVSTGARLYTLNGHLKEVTGVAFSPDGSTLASVGDDMKLWDAHTGTPKGGLPLKGGEDRGASGVAWSPDGSMLAIGSSPLVLWDARTQKVQNEGKIPAIPSLGTVNAVAFSPDGALVATAQSSPSPDQPDCDVLLWDARTSELKQTLRGHKRAVAGLAFSPNGKSLASVSLDGMLKIWPLTGKRPPVTLVPLADERVNPINWIALTEEGFYDASDSPRMRDSLNWHVAQDDLPFETFAATFRRPDVVARALEPSPIAPNSEIGLLLASRSAPPAVAFLAPGDQSKVKSEDVSVQVVVSDDVGVEHLEFRVNGRPVKTAFSVAPAQAITDANRSQALGGKPAPASHTTMVRYNTTITLPPGESKILVRAIARDASGLEGFADINIERELMVRGMMLNTLVGAAALAAQKSLQGNLYVLSVGVSRYKNPTYNLQYTVDDATAFSALWSPMQERLYQKVILTQLGDDQVTVPALRAELTKLIQTTTNKDTVVIFMAGHGLRDNGQDFYFATHEVDFEHPQTTALPWTALTEVLAKVPAKRVVLFLDACHSGSALGESQASNERMAENLSKRAGVMVFASSRGEQVSFESPEWQHGAFTKAVLEGIADGKANLDAGNGQDGNITVAKLLVYLQTRVPKMTKDQQNPACPLMQDFGEPFLLAKLPVPK
ncbi:hypothetical protein IAD21_04494 [Abditibacteriota bacterium]|nr:hypothetical protein IAD21_04494 [Abditibacteriota bacterium]